MEKTLGALEDEQQIVKKIDKWPHAKVDVIREATLRYINVERLQKRIDDHVAGVRSYVDPFAEHDAVEKTFDTVMGELDVYLRAKEGDDARFTAVSIPFQWSVVRKCRQDTVLLAKVHCNCALGEFQTFQDAYKEVGDAEPDAKTARRISILFNRAFNFLQKSFEFGIRVYGYAQGFDTEMTQTYALVHKHLDYLAGLREQRAAAKADVQQPAEATEVSKPVSAAVPTESSSTNNGSSSNQ